jgi:basic amino acid/polyamine antiporter, APA family
MAYAGVHHETGPRLERVIGTGALAATALNTIVGSGIFGLPGLAAAMLGPAAILSYVVCAVLIGLVGLCFAEAGSRVHGAAGLYSYASAAFGPIVGGIVGTLMWAANSVAPSAAVAALLMDTGATLVPAMSGGPLRTGVLVALYVTLAAVNIRGTRSGARVSMALAVIKIAPLAVLAIAGVFAVESENLQWTGFPAALGIGQTAVLLFFAFMGVEGGLNASGEVTNPARTVPRAILLALTLVAALYIGLQVAAQGVLGANLAGNSAPLVATATALFGSWGARVLVVVTVLSTAGYLSADMLGSPRVFHAMADRGQLPRRLAAVHPRLKTPAVAIAVYVTMCAILASTGSFRQLALASASGTLIAYLICCLGLLRLRSQHVATASTPFVAPGGALVPLAASAIILWMLSTLSATELAAAALLVAVSGVVYSLRAWRPRASERGTAELV